MKLLAIPTTLIQAVAITAFSTFVMCNMSFGSEERQQFYSTQDGPQAEKDGFKIHLVSFDQKSSHLRATILVKNDSNLGVELPAKDLVTTWLEVLCDGKTSPATISYTDTDDQEGQHWPDTRPLRRIVVLQPFQSKTYIVDCDYASRLADADTPPSLIAHVLVGPDKKPMDVRLDFPPAPSKVSP